MVLTDLLLERVQQLHRLSVDMAVVLHRAH